MSQNLSLVQYQTDEKGNLYDDNSNIIESAFITPELIDLIEKEKLLEDKPLLEETGATESFEVKCIENSSLNKALSILENEYVSHVLEAANKLKSVFNSDEVYSLMNESRTITNLQHVIKLKKEKFEHNPNVVLKLG
jgi:hypothetical protein